MMGVKGIFPNKAQHELGQHFADPALHILALLPMGFRSLPTV